VIFYLLLRRKWAGGRPDRVAVPGEEGFMHCCDERQIVDVRRRYFPVEEEVVAWHLIRRKRRLAARTAAARRPHDVIAPPGRRYGSRKLPAKAESKGQVAGRPGGSRSGQGDRRRRP
jgi:hypothetical protein